MPSSHLILCHPLLLPGSVPFPMSQLFTWDGQSIGVSASKSVLPKNTQDWSPLQWTGWIPLQSKGLSRVFSNTTVQSIISSVFNFFIVQFSHPYMTTGKTIALTRQTFVGKVTSLLLNMLSRLVITFLPRSVFYFILFFIFTLFYFTILYWFCITLTWIHHGCTCDPKHEPPSHLPRHNIPLGHPPAPAPSMLYPASDIDWWFDSYMIVYMFQCHSPKSSHPLPLPQSPKVHSIHMCLFCCLEMQVF